MTENESHATRVWQRAEAQNAEGVPVHVIANQMGESELKVAYKIQEIRDGDNDE